jgi:hypothetical protein
MRGLVDGINVIEVAPAPKPYTNAADEEIVPLYRPRRAGGWPRCGARAAPPPYPA